MKQISLQLLQETWECQSKPFLSWLEGLVQIVQAFQNLELKLNPKQRLLAHELMAVLPFKTTAVAYDGPAFLVLNTPFP